MQLVHSVSVWPSSCGWGTYSHLIMLVEVYTTNVDSLVCDNSGSLRLISQQCRQDGTKHLQHVCLFLMYKISIEFLKIFLKFDFLSVNFSHYCVWKSLFFSFYFLQRRLICGNTSQNIIKLNRPRCSIIELKIVANGLFDAVQSERFVKLQVRIIWCAHFLLKVATCQVRTAIGYQHCWKCHHY